MKGRFVVSSFGGLVGWYPIGRLYELTVPMESTICTEHHKHEGVSMMCRIAGLEPINFITFASPHLGSRGHKQVRVFSLFVD